MAVTLVLSITEADWRRVLEEHADLLEWAKEQAELEGKPLPYLGDPRHTAAAVLSEALIVNQERRNRRARKAEAA
jgi:uncharacterized membrane protein